LRISLVYKKGAQEEAERVRRKAEASGLEVLGVLPLGNYFEGAEDAVVIVGGDGSFLRIADITSRPIALLRYESFGFFASCDSGRAGELFEDLASGRAERVELPVLGAEFPGGGARAVNEFLLKSCGHSASFDITVTGREDLRASFCGDGVIVATPAGSAAHAMSFGGPLICPGVDAFLLVPVAPIRSNLRPLVVSGKSVIRIEGSAGVQLVADGQRSFEATSALFRSSERRVILIRKESYGDKMRRLFA